MQIQDTLPSWQNIALVVGATAFLSFGTAQMAKTFARGYAIQHAFHHHPWWWEGALRGLSILVGAVSGWILWEQMPGCDECGGDAWGVVLGAASGAGCTFIVAAIKARISGKYVPPETTEPTE